MSILLQVLPATSNDRLEGHWGGVTRPVWGDAESGRLQDPRYVDATYHGMAYSHPQPVGVSNFHISGTGSPSYQ
jgi:hypothetical protein